MRYPSTVIYAFFLAAFFAACGSYKIESEDDPSNTPTDNTESEYSLSLQIQSTDNARINYPLSIFVFDAENECVHTESLSKNTTECLMRLGKGKYTLIAFSGLEGNSLNRPLQFTPTSYLSFADSLYTSTPLQNGKASVYLNQNTTAVLTLSYLVSAVQFSFSGIPSTAKSVEAKISPVSSALTFEGDYRNDQRETTIACRKNGTLWSSPEVYILPCVGSQTRLTVQVSLPERNEAYGYTYPDALKAGFPYRFTGTYAGDIALGGTFQSQGWQQTTEVEFSFDQTGSDQTDKDTDPPTPDDKDASTVTVSELPAEGDLWKECFVCQVKETTSPSACEAVVIANDYMLIPGSELQAYLNDFQFNGLSSWRCLTTEEATYFRNKYYGTSAISRLNQFLLANDVSPFKYDDGDRYFCNEGASSFSFVTQTIIKIGTKKSYYIRPAKTIKFTTR